MAQLSAFRALRPAPAAAARVSSVPYDVVSTAEARAQAEGNPLSFLRVTRAELELPDGADPYDGEVYRRAARNLDLLKRAAPLEVERAPALYLYRLRMGPHVQTGVAGCWSLDEYDAGTIKKHEKTRRDKEDDRTRHIAALRAQTGVVFLTYRAAPAVDAIVARGEAAPPLYDFVAADGVAHTVWRLESAERDALAAAFGGVGELYIADGHHRAASAARAREALRAGRAERPPAESAGSPDTFLAVAFPHDQTRILPYHRLVRDLAGRSPEALAEELERRFGLAEGPAQPAARGTVGVRLGGRWRSLRLPEAAAASPIARLDCQVLQESVLGPLLGIGDPRTDKRIDFVGGIRGTDELERRVASGAAAIAFAMFPVGVEDLFAVADAGEVMPPKSTWFEPKLRDGLLVHEI
jgi:uncharacterized protein (DUF1015 family)